MKSGRPALWFVVPAHGRVELSRICLRMLRRTCDELERANIEATAVVVADDENLDTARELGFGTIRRDNDFLSRKFNDGIQLALDRDYNPRPADYVIPCGSDDWVHHELFTGRLPSDDEVLGFRLACFVDETGTKLVAREIDYRGGVGIRVYPRAMMARLHYRPAEEDLRRACDTSILVNLTNTYTNGRRPRIFYGDLYAAQIVDWKSRPTDTEGLEQLNPFDAIASRFQRGSEPLDPFETLAKTFPADELAAMRALYEIRATETALA